MTTSSWDTET